jgi:DNA-binding NarL/FixJ family response regulator
MKHPADPEERGEIRILFIAGNPTFQPVVTRFLKRCDELSLVGTVQGSEKVLAQALELQPQVIVFDLDTSDRTGLATIADLRAALPEASLIALSLLGADGYRQAVLAAGADDLVVKISLRTDLLPAIRRAAQDGRHGQEHVF